MCRVTAAGAAAILADNPPVSAVAVRDPEGLYAALESGTVDEALIAQVVAGGELSMHTDLQVIGLSYRLPCY